MTTTTVVLVCLAVYRGTLLVTSDRVTRTPRRWLRARGRQRSHRVVASFADDFGRPISYGCRCGWTCYVNGWSDEPPYEVRELQPSVAAPVVRDSAPTEDAARRTLDACAARHYDNATDTSRLGYLLECPWCISLWLGAVGAAVAYVWPDGWWRWPALALAASAVAGLLATIASPDDLDPED